MRVKLQYDGVAEVVDGICRNVSIGGMHIVTDSPRPQGSRVHFELGVADELDIRGIGEVVWMRAESAGPGREPGMGVKFRFLEQRDRQIIFKIVSEHIKRRLEHKHPGAPAPPERPAPAARRPAAPEPAAPPPAIAAPPPEPDPSTAPEPPAAPDSFFSELPPLPEPVMEPAPDQLLPPLDDLPRHEDEEPQGEIELPTYRDGDFDAGLDEPLPPETPPPDTGVYYRQRPARRRDFPVLPVVALLLVAAVAAVYLGWDRIFGPSTPPAPPPPLAGEPAATAPEAAPPAAAAEPPVDEAPPISVENETVSPPPPPPPPAPPPPAPPPAALPEFTRVVDVSWTRRPGGVKVDIKTDGAIPPGRYDTFRLDGENPREVVRLKGVVARYETSEILVTGSPIRRIRIGYHANRELHVVLDMLDRTTRIQRLRVQGSTLEVFVE